MHSLIGKTLNNRYQVIELLGRGGMAEVYKVWDTQRGTHLAMKVLREDLAEDRVFLRRFQREAHNLAKLQHPNIVRFYGLEQEGRLAFILMDFIQGSTLRGQTFDAQAPLPFDRILHIMQSLCSALHYAHQQGIVHCDLKSANIMLDANGKVYLTDFGIARMSDAATATLVGVGTPAYMAPELVRGMDPTPQTDIYALGVVLYELLTGGERPFTGEKASITGTTAEKVRWEQLNLLPTSPCVYNPTIPDALETVVLRCLVKEPKDRYQSMTELVATLEEALKNGQTESESKYMHQTEPQPAPGQQPKVVNGKPGGAVTATRSPGKNNGRMTTPVWIMVGLIGILAVAIIIAFNSQVLTPIVFYPTSTSPTTHTPVNTNMLEATHTALSSYVIDTYMARNLDESFIINSIFSPDEIIHAVVELNKVPEDIIVKASWFIVKAKGLQPGIIIEKPYKFPGGKSGQIDFDLSNENGWPLGDYQVEISINDYPVSMLDFSVQ